MYDTTSIRTLQYIFLVLKKQEAILLLFLLINIQSIEQDGNEYSTAAAFHPGDSMIWFRTERHWEGVFVFVTGY